MAKKPRKQAYVVFKGKIPGIYSGWEECFAQINGFRGQEQKVYESLEAAERAWEEYQSSIVQANPAPSAWPEKCLEPLDPRRTDAKRPALLGLGSRPTKRQQYNAPSANREPRRMLAASRGELGATISPYFGTRAALQPTAELSFARRDSYISLESESSKAAEQIEFGEVEDVLLTREQEAVVDLALRGHNIFLTGAGGSGKTITLKTILVRMQRRKITYQVVAPTGIAALPLNGTTTYSFLGWNPDTLQKPIEEITSVRKRYVVEAIHKIRVIIVEEISMVENQFLERMNLMLRAILRNKEPFGGKQVIFLGDFHQLPPVKPFEYCLQCGTRMAQQKTGNYDVVCENCSICYLDGEKWAFKSDVWQKLKLRHVQLQQIHRQKDQRFQDILYKIRHGIMLNQEEWQTLESKKELPEGICAVRLMSRRKDVDALNSKELAAINTPTKSWDCLDYYVPRFEGSEKDSKPWLEENPLDQHRLPTKLNLKVGAKVVLLSNLDPKNGLVNGSQGEVIGFMKHNGMECDPSIEYTESAVAEVRRENKKKGWNIDTRSAPVVRFANGVKRPIPPIDVTSRYGKNKFYQYLATRVQIPLALAWALTIHKSQGMTLNYLEVLSRDIFERGQFYVALSRGTSLMGLTVTGYSREQLDVDSDVCEFYEHTEWEIFATPGQPPAERVKVKEEVKEITEIPDTDEEDDRTVVDTDAESDEGTDLL